MNAPPIGANRSRRDILALGAAALLGAAEGRAQSSPKRVIWLGPGEKGQERIRKEIASLGLAEGRDLTLTFEAFRDSSKESAEAQADELVGRRPDVIVMVAHWQIELLQKRTRQIPIVFYNMGGDPSRFGLIESFRRPGGNFTGTTIMFESMIARMWQLLKEVRPSMMRGGYGVENTKVQESTVGQESVEEELRVHREVLRDVEARLGIKILEFEVSKDAKRDEIAAVVKKIRADALAFPGLVPDALIEFLKTSKIPACGHRFDIVKKGLLMAVSWDWLEGEMQAVGMAVRILRGESPATIPVYRNNRYFVGVNLRTARAMGIEIPASILLQADLVVE